MNRRTGKDGGGATPPADASATPAEIAFIIRYEVQEDEGLVKIGQKFGTDRPALLEVNGDMGDKKPYVEPGDVILVPVVGMTIEEVEAVPGYAGRAE